MMSPEDLLKNAEEQRRKQREQAELEEKLARKKLITQIVLGVSAVFLLLLTVSAVNIVGATQRGIIYTFGKPSEEIKTPGIHWTAPVIQTMKRWSLVPKPQRIFIDIGDEGAITKDNQVIGTTVRVLYAFKEEELYKAATQYSTPVIERALEALSISGMKSVIGKYTIFDIATNQDTIVKQFESRLKSSVSQYPISITQVTVENFDWSEAFDAQIRATMEAAQAVRKAEQEVNIRQQNMRKLEIEASAKAQALVAEADGRLKAAELDAKAEIEKARGRNEANRLIQQNMSVEIKIRELEIAKIDRERWDGRQVPLYVPLTPAGGIVTLPSVK